MRLHWQSYAAHLAGFALLGIVLNSLTAWTPSHFIRTFSQSPGQSGFWLGTLIAIFGTSGILAGGWWSDRTQRLGRLDGPMRVGVISALGCLLFGAVARRGAAAGMGGDPVPQALVITGIVVAFSATALGVAILLRLFDETGGTSLRDTPKESQSEETNS
jgi:hypothetical protein